MTLPPIGLYGATLCCFVLQADRAHLQRLCDAYLNLGGTTYEPVLPIVAFVAADVQKAHALDPDQNLGWMPERDYAFWVPLRAGTRINGRFEVERFVWFQPFMWIDNPAAVKDGREIFGLEKCAARLSGPRQSDHLAEFSVEAIASSLQPGVEAKFEELVRVRAGTRTALGSLPNEWQCGTDAITALTRQLESVALDTGWARDLGLLAQLLTGQQWLAALKQFPCVTDSRSTCYQAVVETPSRPISPIRGGFLHGGYTVAVKPFASHRIAENLGLSMRTTPDGWQEAASLCSVCFRFDFDLGHGREVARIR